MPQSLLAAAVAFVLLITITLVHQIRYLFTFWGMHHWVVWAQAKMPANYSEIEDPLLALLVRMHLMRPRNREQGEYAPPEDDPELQEPHRTEDALSKAFSCGVDLPIGALVGRSGQWWQRRRKRKQQAYAAGYATERLLTWLNGASGTHLLGIGYMAVQFVLQMLMSFSIGFLSVHPFGLTRPGKKVGLIITIVLNLTMAGSTGWGSANDFLDGLVTTSCYLLEALALCFTLASVLVMGSGLPEDSEHIAQVTTALTFASYAASTLKFATYLPLAFTGYDILVVPIVAKFRTSDAGCDWRTALVTIVTAPLVIVKDLFGIDTNFVQAVDMIDASCDNMLGVLHAPGSIQESKVDSDEDSEAEKAKREEDAAQRWSFAFTEVARNAIEDQPTEGFDGLVMGQQSQVNAASDNVDNCIVEMLTADLEERHLAERPLNQLLLEDLEAEVAVEGGLPLSTHLTSPARQQDAMCNRFDTTNMSLESSLEMMPGQVDGIDRRWNTSAEHGPAMQIPFKRHPTRPAPQLAPQLKEAFRINTLKQRATRRTEMLRIVPC